MQLYYASTALSGESPARALSEALEVLDPLVTDVHDRDDGTGVWDIGAHFDGRPDPAGLGILSRLYAAPDFTIARVEDRDWVAQVRAELTPVPAGRFVIFGGHDRRNIPLNRVSLEIEAAQAFGTGHHASTVGCLEALDKLEKMDFNFRKVADIGGGTGVLAMAAASILPVRAIAGDIDPVATETARANVAANGLSGIVGCVTAAGFNHPRLRAGAPYDLIFANILAAPLRRLAPQVRANQGIGAFAILSGILNRQANAVSAVYRGHGYRIFDIHRVGEWSTLMLRLGR